LSLPLFLWHILCDLHAKHLTNRWSEPLAGAMTKFEFMRPLSMFAALAPASGGSAPSR